MDMRISAPFVIDIINEYGIQVDTYTENDKLCGYELNTYTNGGVNQNIFLDFRDTECDPTDGQEVCTSLKEYVDSIDIDEEILTNRYDKKYCEDFTLTESLKDFKDWKKNLKKLVKEIESKVY